MDSENPTWREHKINTIWQELVDTIYATKSEDFQKDAELGLEVLNAVKLPLSYEILRVGSIKVADAIIRIEEEKKGG